VEDTVVVAIVKVALLWPVAMKTDAGT